DHFYHINGTLEDVCQQVITDQLHILVFTDIGMDPPTTLVAGLRLAPVQCMAWGHPITSGLPTIDYFLSSELMEPENAKAHYCEQLIPLPNISICYEKPSIPQPTKTRSDFQLREDAIVYLSCQSLFKYLPQFDAIFAQIAQRVPQAQFAFLASHATSITAQFSARLSRAFANFGLNSEDFCVVVPRQDWISYLNLNSVSDVFLDTFSWSGGNTALEAIACGLPVVTSPGELMRSRHSYGILQMMGVTETIAQDEQEYIEIAVRLGLDTQWRKAIVQKIYERHSQLYNDRSCVTALESFYKQVVRQGIEVNSR
ncbi:MAG TPA: glycosyltransferase, partial [Coleofasciculaceae cyanobacterium]